MTDSSPLVQPVGSRSAGRRVVLAVALVCLLPLLAAMYFRFVSPPAVATLVGQPLAPAAFPYASLQHMDGQPMEHPPVSEYWLVVHAGAAACDAICRDALYLTRQARTAQGRAMERIRRVWIVTDGGLPASDLLALHPDLLLLKATDSRAIEPLVVGAAIHLVDRRGLLVFRYAASSNPQAFIRELGKLVKF